MEKVSKPRYDEVKSKYFRNRATKHFGNYVKFTVEDFEKMLVKGCPRIHKKYKTRSAYALFFKMFTEFFDIMIMDLIDNNNIFVVKENPFIRIWIGKLSKKENIRKYKAGVKTDFSAVNYKLNSVKMNYRKHRGTREYCKRIKIPLEMYRKMNTRTYFTDEL